MNQLQTGLFRSTLSVAFLCVGLMLCSAQKTIFMDTCTVNDICEAAIEFPPLETDSASVCIEGCVLGALPDSFSGICGMDTLPTIWYEINTDLTAEYLNVNLTF